MKHLSGIWLSLLIAGAAPAASEPQVSPAISTAHPLDPLGADEIGVAVKVLKADPRFPAGSLFATLRLQEPTKQEGWDHRAGEPVSRRAFAILLDRPRNKVYEAVVNLGQGKVERWDPVPGVQPGVCGSEYAEFTRIVEADPRWKAALAVRGIAKPEAVRLDGGWASGSEGYDGNGHRIMRGLPYYRGDAKNWYSRPVEGLVPVVDMTEGRMIDLIDTGAVPVKPDASDLDEKSIGPQRSPPKPLVIAQPAGTSFTIRGNEVQWQKWKFRFSVDSRSGLVLHTVSYLDGERTRRILYRASLSEMLVPYGDTDTNWSWRNAFDVGEYGIGNAASVIERGTDVPENATLLDAVIADDAGEVVKLEQAVAIYERDGGLLWKHLDPVARYNESRRSRELVVSYLTSIGNYDYGINWVFRMDGSLELDAVLTGIMLAKGVDPSGPKAREACKFGHRVSPGIEAPHHQHFFNFRLDFDVDGTKNSVAELDTHAMPKGPDNPRSNGMMMGEIPLKSEKSARRDMSMQTARKWKIVNDLETTSLGTHPGFLLVPGENSVPYVGVDSLVRRRAGLIDHHFWVTRFRPEEIFASGAYPNQSKGGDGLPAWQADDEPLVNEDVVVWYTMGITHIPRPEEWPVMTAHHAGFKLLPAGFFTRNPALDVPR